MPTKQVDDNPKWWQRLWRWSLDRPLPVGTTYFVLTVITLLLFGLIIIELDYRASRQIVVPQPGTVEDGWDAIDEMVGPYLRLDWLVSIQVKMDQLIAENPDNPWPLITRAYLDLLLEYLLQEPIESDAAKQALDIQVNDVEAYAQLADYFRQTGHVEELAQAVDKAVTADPDWPDAPYWRGQSLKYQGDYDAAREVFEQCSNSEEIGMLCLREIIPATRTITITLKSDHFTVATQAQLDITPEQFYQYLAVDSSANREPLYTVMQAIWGDTAIGSWALFDYWLPERLEKVDVVDTVYYGETDKIYYSSFWGYALHLFDDSYSMNLKYLPVAAYHNPTTVTVVTDGASVNGAGYPYHQITGNQVSWRIDQLNDKKANMIVHVSPGSYHTLKLWWATHYLRDITLILIYLLPTALGLLFLFQFRINSGMIRTIDTENPIFRVLHPQSLWSWSFELALFAISIVTVLYPLWGIFFENLYYRKFESVYANVALMLLIIIRLATLDWYRGDYKLKHLIRLGGVIFVFFLSYRLFPNSFSLFQIPVAFIIYRFFLIHDRQWLYRLDWSRLFQLFSQKRSEFIEKITGLDRFAKLKQALQEQELALARGKVKPEDFQQTRQILKEQVEQYRKTADELHQDLGIPADTSPTHILFGLGPQTTPLNNGLFALACGVVPYFVFLVLASWTETLVGSISLLGTYITLYDTIGVPWGPIYLFFFGFFFHVIRGNYGVTKALIFSASLAGLNFLYQWMWYWDQLNVVEIWGITVRLLVTFVFTGLLMDWMTIGFSWRQIRLSYDSPAITTVISVVATALTTVITAAATGTLTQLISVAVQGTTAAFGGGQGPLGP